MPRTWLILMPLFLGACAGAASPPSPAIAPAVEGRAPSSPSSPARALLERALAGFGGANRVDRLRTITSEATAPRRLPDGRETGVEQRSYVEFPDRFRREVLLEGMMVASVIGPDGSFVLSPLGTLPLPDEERVEVERSLARSPLSLLKSRQHETFTVIAEGEGEIDGAIVDYLRVLFIGDSNRLAVERRSGRVLELLFTDQPVGAPVEEASEVVIRYDDHREIDGLIYPFRSTATRDGEPMTIRTVQSLEVDVKLDPALFQPPARPPEGALPQGSDEDRPGA